MSGLTSRESDKFMLRMPDGMRDRVRIAAEANGRSMNAEIVAALEDKFPEEHYTTSISIALNWLQLALYKEEIDKEDMRKHILAAQEDLEALQGRLIRGDRGGL